MFVPCVSYSKDERQSRDKLIQRSTDKVQRKKNPDEMTGIFLLTYSSRLHCGLGIDSACDKNE
jgi:hypothetical protein